MSSENSTEFDKFDDYGKQLLKRMKEIIKSN